MRKLLAAASVVAALIAIGAITAGAGGAAKRSERVRVNVPLADRFVPFATTVHVGDVVRWVNNDEDDHTVVSDDAFNTTGHLGTDELIGGDGGKLTLTFHHPGTFVYYCRFHAKLDHANQPVAPGPDGGVQANNGNFGTPMSGVVTVLPDGT